MQLEISSDPIRLNGDSNYHYYQLSQQKALKVLLYPSQADMREGGGAL